MAKRRLQCAKQFGPSCSTEAGTQIDLSAEQATKAPGSIPLSLDPVSKVTVDRDWQDAKQLGPRRSRDAGRSIDSSDEQHEKAESPILAACESASNVTRESFVQ
jgi:hypothetical protein